MALEATTDDEPIGGHADGCCLRRGVAAHGPPDRAAEGDRRAASSDRHRGCLAALELTQLGVIAIEASLLVLRLRVASLVSDAAALAEQDAEAGGHASDADARGDDGQRAAALAVVAVSAEVGAAAVRGSGGLGGSGPAGDHVADGRVVGRDRG